MTFRNWPRLLLAALPAPHTTQNQVFLEEWEKAEHTACQNNPLSAVVDLPNSTRCKELAHGVYARAYRSPAVGTRAAVEQLKEQRFAAILAALHSGDPYAYPDWQLVVGALGTWGAHVFAADYAKALNQATQTAQELADSAAGGALHAWTHLGRVFSHDMPAALYSTAKLNRHALASLGRRR